MEFLAREEFYFLLTDSWFCVFELKERLKNETFKDLGEKEKWIVDGERTLYGDIREVFVR